MKPTVRLRYIIMLLVVMLPGILNLQLPSAYAANSIRVFINNTELMFPDTQPFIDTSGRIIVPVRSVAEAMGCDVIWNGATRTATMSRGRVTVELTIGKDEFTVLGVKKKMNTTATQKNGRVLVPVRFVAEAFGADVVWDSKTKTVYITDEGYDVYKQDKFVWDIEADDASGINSDGLLSLNKKSGLLLDEFLVGDGGKKVMAITITVDAPEADVSTQIQETVMLLKQCFDDDTVTQIMDYALVKQTGADVIERKIFKFDDYRIYVTGYFGPIIIYVYFP